MESLSVSLAGSALVKSLVNQGHESPEDSPESPESPGDVTHEQHQPNVNTYDTFMKKHLSNYGYYSNGEFKVLSKLFIVRSGVLFVFRLSHPIHLASRDYFRLWKKFWLSWKSVTITLLILESWKTFIGESPTRLFFRPLKTLANIYANIKLSRVEKAQKMRNRYEISANVLKYLKGRLRMELNEYDQRLGANEPADFPPKRFAQEERDSQNALTESKSSECKLRRWGSLEKFSIFEQKMDKGVSYKVVLWIWA